MLNRILGGGLLLALALAALWMFGNARERAGVMKERAEWHQQMAGFEKRAAQIIVERVKETRKIEQVRAETSNKVGYDVQKRIGALALAIERMRAQRQGNGNGDGSYLPVLSYATIDPTGAGEASDMVACGEAVIKAEGWQEYYRGISK